MNITLDDFLKAINTGIPEGISKVVLLGSVKEADRSDFFAKDLEETEPYRERDAETMETALFKRLSAAVTYEDNRITKLAAYSYDRAGRSANTLRQFGLKLILYQRAAELYNTHSSDKMKENAMWSYARLAECYAFLQDWLETDQALKQAEKIAENLRQDPFSIAPYSNAVALTRKFKPPETSLPAYVAK